MRMDVQLSLTNGRC